MSVLASIGSMDSMMNVSKACSFWKPVILYVLEALLVAILKLQGFQYSVNFIWNILWTFFETFWKYLPK